jgi:starch synthase
MYAMLYGTVPIVHKTGGLADTVTDATSRNLSEGSATGIVFGTWTERAFLNAFNRAQRVYRDPETLSALRRSGMRQDFSWSSSAKQYVQLFHEALAAP